MTIRVAVFDLDSTICDTSHRHYMLEKIKAGEATWVDYSMMCADDKPIEGTIALVRLLDAAGIVCDAISGRNSEARDLTWQWMRQHSVPLSRIRLRAPGDFSANEVSKVSYIKERQENGEQIVLFVEDYAKAADAVRQQCGVPVLLVNPNYGAGSLWNESTHL